MSVKQFFAQVAVFSLLGVNVAAYYFFWPSHGGGSSEEVKSASPSGGVHPVEKAPASRALTPVAASMSPPGFPEIPQPQPSSPISKDDGDPINAQLKEQLLKEIQRQGLGAPPAVLTPRLASQAEALPSFGRKDDTVLAPLAPADAPTGTTGLPLRQENNLRPGEHITLPLTDTRATPDKNNTDPLFPAVLPQLKADPLNVPPPAPAPAEVQQPMLLKGVVPASFSTGAAVQPQSPWLIKMEVVGSRTRLTAQVRPRGAVRPVAEFKILCDRVETKESQNCVQAVGKVAFVGAGLKGSCERLTLPFHEMQILFEDNVEIAHDQAALPTSGAELTQSAANVLRSDRMIWASPPLRAADAPREERRPVTFSPLAPPTLPNESR